MLKGMEQKTNAAYPAAKEVLKKKREDRCLMPWRHFYGVRCLGTALCSESRLAWAGPPRWPGEKRRRAAALQIKIAALE